MSSGTVSRLIEVLRSTLLELEETEGVSPTDPAFVSLKGILLRRIADLVVEGTVPLGPAELLRTSDAAGPATDLIDKSGVQPIKENN